ncbi:uncharacterized protein LOC129780434 [Toxorhynchites rutilus septentrionalis]|uniref:uncharacterized protein LOC129780434 n=1 Tax=Toxorhynchites rutilus septentrionalis TaxID=329112 RepID=UPI00247874A7|nr:uncharacterized protein LOC129780434 [Toxorhynchites rutilus septentrionalis]
MVCLSRFLVTRFINLHGYLRQNYLKILVLCLVVGVGTGIVHWLTLNQPKFFETLHDNIREFPLGVTFGILTVVLIATLLLYALRLESTEKVHVRSRTAIRLKYVDFILLCLNTQLKEATERYLHHGTHVPDQLDAMHTEIEDCIDRFRENARKLLNAPGVPGLTTLQEHENYFRLDQQGTGIGEEILKLKRNSKSLLSERAIKALLTK